MRILSLLSSGTEILHALELGDKQVGRSHECDYPESVLALPVCSRPGFPVSGSSAEIDGLVKERLASALSIYELDAERIRELRPTHILTQTQCKVCAVSLEDVERSLRAEMATNAQVIAVETNDLKDLWRDIRLVAERCEVQEAGEKLVARLQAEMAAIEEQAAHATHRPTVAAIEWLDPLMAAGNWVPELIAKAGGRNLFGEAGQHSPWMTWDELREADPDVIIALPCGFDLSRTRSEMMRLAEDPRWRQLRAVRERRVFLCDGNQYMNRPGPRLVDSLEIFAEILHPELFEARRKGTGWELY